MCQCMCVMCVCGSILLRTYSSNNILIKCNIVPTTYMYLIPYIYKY